MQPVNNWTRTRTQFLSWHSGGHFILLDVDGLSHMVRVEFGSLLRTCYNNYMAEKIKMLNFSLAVIRNVIVDLFKPPAERTRRPLPCGCHHPLCAEMWLMVFGQRSRWERTFYWELWLPGRTGYRFRGIRCGITWLEMTSILWMSKKLPLLPVPMSHFSSPHLCHHVSFPEWLLFFCPSLQCWGPWISVHRLAFTLSPRDSHPPPRLASSPLCWCSPGL